MAPRFDSTITLGNLISVATIVVGLSIGYATIVAEQDALSRRLDQVDVVTQDGRTTLSVAGKPPAGGRDHAGFPDV
ncbi:MAG: hypothetical protein U5N55_11645 [Cypionkella sp.]|nr:hypothetical protein [Cypionkella sp.]